MLLSAVASGHTRLLLYGCAEHSYRHLLISRIFVDWWETICALELMLWPSIAVHNYNYHELQVIEEDIGYYQFKYSFSTCCCHMYTSSYDGIFFFCVCASYGSWLKVSSLKNCNRDEEYSPSLCFGCCYDYPEGSGCTTKDCLVENSLVLSCCKFINGSIIDSHSQKNERHWSANPQHARSVRCYS